MWLDTPTGLYHTINRDYSPTLGRWMQQDPAGYVDGRNLAEAERSDPAGSLDPTGLSGCRPAYTPTASSTASSSAKEESAQFSGFGAGINFQFTAQNSETVEIGPGVQDHTPAAAKVSITFMKWQSFLGSISDMVDVIQLVRQTDLATGKPVYDLPQYQARATATGWLVDARVGDDLAYYGLGNDGKPESLRADYFKNAPREPLLTRSAGRVPNGFSEAGNYSYNTAIRDYPGAINKKGFNRKFEFQTYLVVTAGPDKGAVFHGVAWNFTIDANGQITHTKPTFINTPTTDFGEAIAKWNAQAALPSGSSLKNSPGQQPVDLSR